MTIKGWNTPKRMSYITLKNQIFYESVFLPELPIGAVMDVFKLHFPFDQLEVGDYFVVEVEQAGYKFLAQNVLRTNKRSVRDFGELHCKKFVIREWGEKPSKDKMVVRIK